MSGLFRGVQPGIAILRLVRGHLARMRLVRGHLARIAIGTQALWPAAIHPSFYDEDPL